MSRTEPPGYRGPMDPGRDPNLVMADPVAQNLIADIVTLHQELCVKLDRDIELAAMGQADPASGYVTGSGDHDQMDARITAKKQAEAERARRVKNARQELRNVVAYYKRGQQPRRARVESIDYLGSGQRKVG